jgi:hypothetical protein
VSEKTEDNGTPLQATAREPRRKVKTTEHHSRLQQEIVGGKRTQRNTTPGYSKRLSEESEDNGTPLQDTARDCRRKVKTTEHHYRLQQEIDGGK